MASNSVSLLCAELADGRFSSQVVIGNEEGDTRIDRRFPSTPKRRQLNLPESAVCLGLTINFKIGASVNFQ